MFTLLIFTFLGFFAGARESRRMDYPGNKLSDVLVSRILWSGSVGACGLVLGLVPASIIGDNSPQVFVDSVPVPLIAIRTVESLRGKFILASGTISSQPVFHYYYGNSDGSFSPGQIAADSTVRIVEDPELKNKGSLIFQTKRIDPTSPLAKWGLLTKPTQRARFTVPAGSVTRTFSIQ